MQCNGLQLLSPEAFTLNVEYRSIVKDPVQGQQCVILVEVGSPMVRVLVTGEYNVEVTFFVVSPINQIEEQPGILLVELAVPNFINNQAGRTDEAVEDGCFLTCPSGGVFLSFLVFQRWLKRRNGI